MIAAAGAPVQVGDEEAVLQEDRPVSKRNRKEQNVDDDSNFCTHQDSIFWTHNATYRSKRIVVDLLQKRRLETKVRDKSLTCEGMATSRLRRPANLTESRSS